MKKAGRKRKQFTEIERMVIETEYWNQDKSAAEIAKNFKVSEMTIRRRLKEWQQEKKEKKSKNQKSKH